MKYYSLSLAETQLISLILAKKLRSGWVVFLRGGLGSGKTTLIKGVAEYLGIKRVVRSPTFVLAKTYQLPKPIARGANCLIHIDAYRMTSPRDLESIGWHEFVSNPKAIILVENPGRTFGHHKPNLTIKLRTLADDRRLIEF